MNKIRAFNLSALLVVTNITCNTYSGSLPSGPNVVKSEQSKQRLKALIPGS